MPEGHFVGKSNNPSQMMALIIGASNTMIWAMCSVISIYISTKTDIYQYQHFKLAAPTCCIR